MSLLGHDKRTVKSWKAAPEEMMASDGGNVTCCGRIDNGM